MKQKLKRYHETTLQQTVLDSLRTFKKRANFVGLFVRGVMFLYSEKLLPQTKLISIKSVELNSC